MILSAIFLFLFVINSFILLTSICLSLMFCLMYICFFCNTFHFIDKFNVKYYHFECLVNLLSLYYNMCLKYSTGFISFGHTSQKYALLYEYNVGNAFTIYSDVLNSFIRIPFISGHNSA
jgi:hypothetical protein